ncbi:hypothetical protein [Actinacidiphila glaucinigra]|uniref:Uncharacterized protein n=1 Tax=Actinacidiphila glaucinigra TaxID=235986 RepID=A0A239NY99_9ACTN|nr:hypothetical protein [Actinacidiphila glaucinigra]SNT59857.1 hypothetical protein SAMN05216252_1585 [Actinacidiphila glaucinigra]
MSTLRFAPVTAEGLIADLDLPPAAYRVLLKLRSLSEPGGRIEIDQATIAGSLDLSRPSVTDSVAAISAMDRSERLDDPRFVDRYRSDVAAHQDQLAQQRKRKAARKATVSRRGALHAVG